MCRLLGFTPSLANRNMRTLFFHQLMLQHQAEGQDDGAGVSDGRSIYKSGLTYSQIGLNWLPNLDHTTSWMGHVRKASRGTDRPSPQASHPYYYKDSGLIAMHNGFITGTGESDEGEPNVDSYRAFKKLSAMIGDGDLSTSILNEWISGFGPYSEWAFMLKHKNELWTVRGVRPMFWMRLLEGYVLSTSIDSLVLFGDWVEMFWGKHYVLGQIKELSAHHGMRINSENKARWFSLSAREQQPPPVQYYWLREGEEGTSPLIG